MRILLVHNNYKVRGGEEVFVREVAGALIKAGHEVAYFCTADVDTHECTYSEFFPAAPDYLSQSVVTKIREFPKTIYNMHSKIAITKVLKLFRPNIVHAFAVYTKLTPSVLDACHNANYPVVMSCNDYKHICPNYKLFHHGNVCEDCKGGKFYRATYNRCVKNSIAYSAAATLEAYYHNWRDVYTRNVSIFTFASEFMAEKTVEFWYDRKFSWRILRNPVSIPPTHCADCAGSYALFFGRLIEEKGVDILLRAASSAPSVPFKIVGDGPDAAALRAMAESSNLSNVEFLGPRWGDEMDEILCRARFVCVPSIWHENFPYVILQAFAAGKPVIGTDRGGIPELVEDGKRGLIYPANDSGKLAQNIRQLWEDTRRVNTMGHNAREYLEREFNPNRFYGQLMAVYQAAMS